MVRTLPSLVTVESVRHQTRALRLTLVFHPDVTRIGGYADVTTWRSGTPRPNFDAIVGRCSPSFSDGEPLDEPHVSRSALRIRSERGGVRVEVADEGVKARIGSHEATRYWCSEEVLYEGIPLRLGHGVVLYLRDVALPSTKPEVSHDAYPGASVEAHGVRQLLAAAAGCHLPVLLLGESGVGKELAARAIHYTGDRGQRPFVALNMGAIPESLAAAELFGTRKGAFTGAEVRAGAFRNAHRGTLFLDEIGDAPPQVQAQLLRVLQDGEVPVLGGVATAVDVRIIAATDQSIAPEGGFRNALKHRLAGITIAIPPLRERREDIGPQLLRTLSLAGLDDPETSLSAVMADPETAAGWARVVFDFLSCDWPGNSRELDKAVTRTLAGHESIPAYAVVDHTKVVDDEQVEAAYEACRFEPKSTALALGISHGAIYRRLRAHPRCRIAADITEAELDAAIAAIGAEPAKLSEWLRVSEHGVRRLLRERAGFQDPDS